MGHYICFFENAIKKIKQLWMRIGSFQPKIPSDSKNLANLGWDNFTSFQKLGFVFRYSKCPNTTDKKNLFDYHLFAAMLILWPWAQIH